MIQIAERAEPAERGGEKNNSGEITEQQVSEPASSRIFAREPNRGDERCQRDPAKPALVEWRKTKHPEQTADNGGQPGPGLFQDRKHAAILQAPNPKLQISKKKVWTGWDFRDSG